MRALPCFLFFVFFVKCIQAKEMPDLLSFHEDFTKKCSLLHERCVNMQELYQKTPDSVVYYVGDTKPRWPKIIKFFKDISEVNKSHRLQFNINMNNIKLYGLDPTDTASRVAFGFYCAYMPYVKQIENILFTTDKTSYLYSDLHKIKTNIIGYSKLFNSREEIIADFLKITPEGNVYVNFYDIRNHMVRKAKNILATINRINLNELSISKKHKKYLKNRYSYYKDFYTVDVEIKMSMPQEVRKLMERDLSKCSYLPNVNVFDNLTLLEEAERNVFYPLNIPGFKISDGIRERENLKLVAMFNNTSQKVKKVNSSAPPSKKLSAKNPNNSKEDFTPSTLPSDIEEELNIETTNETISPNASPTDEKNNIEQSEQDEKLEYLNNLKELQATTLNWLKNLELMVQESKITQINSQSYKISTLIEKVSNLENIYLMEQLAEATSQTALRIAMMKTHENQAKLILSTRKKERLGDFLYTPLASLKDKIRIKKFYSLLTILGGKYDESREGSRVSLTINGHEISIHKPHGKYGSYLDSGRITSLRQLLIESGLDFAALLD